MPCMSYSPEEDLAHLSAQVVKLNRIACNLLKVLDMKCKSPESDIHGFFTEETKVWIRRHEEEDQRRQQIEEAQKLENNIRKNALDKLTAEEKRVLGVK